MQINKNHRRQGDVILKRIKSVPEEAKEEKVKKIVLAYGEVTGHSHQIAEGKARLFKYDEKTYLSVTSPYAALKHEEHREIQLPEGDYEVVIQKNYEPSGWKKVVD
jgi:hypothetical protein